MFRILIFIAFLLVGGKGIYGQQLARSANRQNFTSIDSVKDRPILKWKFQTEGKIFSSPVVFGDMVLIGSCDSNLYALDKIDAKLLWKFKTNGEVRSSVAIASNRVFFLSSDGIFYALDADSGLLQWEFKTEGEKFYDTWDYYQSSPAIQGGMIYFGCGDGHIYALDVQTGALKWKFKTGGIVHASPTLTEDAVLIGSFDGVFYCLETNGQLRWKFNTIGQHYFPLGEIQFHATVSDSTVYFGSRDFNLYALKIKDGGGHWVDHQHGSWPSVPSLGGKQLIATMSDSYSVLVMDKDYGGMIYEPNVPINVFSSASISGKCAYFGALNGVVYKLDLATGGISSIFQTDAGKINSAQFFDRTGKLKSDLDRTYNYDVNLLFADYLKMGSIFSTIWIEGRTLYFGSADGAVYALE
ncbi:PQQ-like beta-propeller repeat protein [Sphingobacterium sp. SYP-B4668]|uniref:PQQ-like beta-propeller repeat protein n=1 Tax=Sphingobacterium sp. SYP-B4668 TaxID=2996035 RepID=UPI0022DD697D|nr:PQQ-like beta-propeller repeat protein [Sphingobacterium sp. SYP-B4668]